MKALAFANNDMAVVAWTFGGKLANCLGFAVYRIDVRAGTEQIGRASCRERVLRLV